MLPILINYKVIHHTLTYWNIIQPMIIPIYIKHTLTLLHRWRLMICITILTINGQYCWGKLLLCWSSCKQICRRPHALIWRCCCVNPKCQTRAGVSGNIKSRLNMSLYITDSKFSNRALVWITQMSSLVNWVAIWLEHLGFLPQ